MSIAQGQCVGGGGPCLDGFSFLAWSPQQWGDHVACQSNGQSALELAATVKADGGAPTLAQIAERFGVSEDEARDAIRWAEKEAANGVASLDV